MLEPNPPSKEPCAAQVSNNSSAFSSSCVTARALRFLKRWRAKRPWPQLSSLRSKHQSSDPSNLWLSSMASICLNTLIHDSSWFIDIHDFHTGNLSNQCACVMSEAFEYSKQTFQIEWWVATVKAYPIGATHISWLYSPCFNHPSLRIGRQLAGMRVTPAEATGLLKVKETMAHSGTSWEIISTNESWCATAPWFIYW